MVTTREVVKAALDPIRKNDLEARRRKLGLSRAALARILDVDPATVFRRERGPLVRLWDYALRGVEAEAADKATKVVLRSFKADLGRTGFIPDQLDAQGYSYLAEKMHEARQQRPRRKPRPARPHPREEWPTQNSRPDEGPTNRRRTGQLSKEQIKWIADRAEKAKH